MFMLCEAMKWSHLPNGGGIYEQDPDLLDGFLIIFSVRSEHDQEEAKKNDRGKHVPRPKGASRAR